MPPQAVQDKVVDVPGVGTVQFPGTMSDDDIGAAIKKNYPNLGTQSQGSNPYSTSFAGIPGSTAPPQTSMGLSSLLEEAKQVPGNILKGAAKSLVSTPLAWQNVGHPAKPGEPVIFQNPRTGTRYAAPSEAENAQLQPQGVAQNVGAGLEQTGEMALTGGPFKAGAEELIAHLPQWARSIPFISRLLTPAARVGAEALNTGTNAAIHQQNVPAAAITGATGATIGESLPFLSQYLKDKAVEQYNKALNPTTIQNKNLANKIVPQLLDQGQIAKTLPWLTQKAASQAGEFGSKIQAAENALPATASSSIQPVLDKLDQIRGKYTIGGNVPSTMQPQVAYIDQLKNDVASMAQNGQARTQDLIQMRRLLDDPVAASGGYAGAQFLGNKQVQKATANSLREIINTDNPDLAELNKSYSFWKNVQRVAGASATRKTGQQGFGPLMMDAARGGIGVTAGFMHGGAQEAGAFGIGSLLLSHAAQTPAWRTTSAVFKNQVADALASDNAGTLVKLMSRFGASYASVAMQQNTQSQSNPQAATTSQPSQ